MQILEEQWEFPIMVLLIKAISMLNNLIEIPSIKGKKNDDIIDFLKRELEELDCHPEVFIADSDKFLDYPEYCPFSEGTEKTKIIATEGYGGKVVIYGKDTKDTIEKSMSLAKSENLTYLNCFEDENLIAGHGCIGLDIIEEKPDTDVIFCPIGGGAFISGVAIAVKHSKPEVKIIGVEPEGANAMYLSLKKDKLVGIEKANTIADGLAVERPGAKPFEITRKYVDEVIVVTDEEIKIAMTLLLERAKLLVEPAGAASLAAIISRRLNFKDKEIVAILSGGNIDLDKLT